MKGCYILLFLVLFSCSCSTSNVEVEKPNILFILVDDLGKEWVSSYGADSISTPNVDRLATTGLQFNNAWVMPQCTPTRVSFLTGQYPFRNGWINHWDVPRWGAQCHFDPKYYKTVGRAMQALGYKTCIAGKWQINDFRVQPNILAEHGFDEYCMWTGFETGNPASAERYWDPYIHTSEGSNTYTGEFGEDVFTNFILGFMEKHQHEPMFIYYPMALTHTPLVTTPKDPGANTAMDKHKAMVSYMDYCVGRLVKGLDKLGLREKTIVVWTSDNGTAGSITGHLKSEPVKGGKIKLSQSGVAMPFIVNAPAYRQKGVKTDELVDITDLYPTFLALAGEDIGDWQGDGRSFSEFIKGNTDKTDRNWILSMGGRPAKIRDGRVVPRTNFAPRAIGNKTHKIIVNEDREITALFNIESDPFEKNNRLGRESDLDKEEKNKLLEALSSMPAQDALPRYDPTPVQSWDINPKDFE